MAPNKEFKVQAKGEYHWELLFDIDNTTNSGTIKREVTVESEVTMSYENMVKSLDTKQIAASMGLEVGGIFEILNIGVKGEISGELKSEYEKISTTKTEFKKKTTKTDTYEVGANSSLKLYRLMFSAPGMNHATDTLSTNTKAMPDVPIEISGRAVPVLKDIEVLYTDDKVSHPEDIIQESHGYSADINKGYGGKFVWLRAVWAHDVAQGVTGIELNVQEEKNASYQDLAAGAGGKFRYLKMLRDPQSKQRITEVALWRRIEKSGGELHPPADKFRFRSDDLNVQRGGDDLFVVWNGACLK